MLPVLDPANVGLTEVDPTPISTPVPAAAGSKSSSGCATSSPSSAVYAGRIGAEFAHVSTSAERLWLQEQFREGRLIYRSSKEEQVNLLRQLTCRRGPRTLPAHEVRRPEALLAGGWRALIPRSTTWCKAASSAGVQEIVIGMAHRGRLNVLVNVLGKMPKDLFAEFEGNTWTTCIRATSSTTKGFSSDVSTPGGPVHLSLAFNPRTSKLPIRWWRVRCARASAAAATRTGDRCCPS